MAFSLLTLAFIRLLCRWWAAMRAEAEQMWAAHQQYLDDVCDEMLGVRRVLEEKSDEAEKESTQETDDIHN